MHDMTVKAKANTAFLFFILLLLSSYC